MASTTGQVLPDAKLERRTRRKFTEQEKFALLEEFDCLKCQLPVNSVHS